MARITLSDDKWVRVMNDHCSTGIWAKDGCNVDEDELPVTDELKVRLRNWCISFDRQDWGPHFEENLERDKATKEIYHAIMVEGLDIAFEIKNQLPDWTVKLWNGGEYHFSQGYFDLPNDLRNNTTIEIGMKKPC